MILNSAPQLLNTDTMENQIYIQSNICRGSQILIDLCNSC